MSCFAIQPRSFTRLWRFLAAVLVICLTGCATSHKKRTVYRYEPGYGVASGEFERAMVALGGGLLPGNDAVLLNNGDAFFPSILEAIREAKHSVNIELYIFARGQMAETFAEVLGAKAREGVEVRVLVDAIGERLGPLFAEMREAGVQLHVYKPWALYSIARVNDRTHRKIITVDGRIGFTGGLSIDDRWIGNARNPDEWRDTVVRLEGPVVLQMQRLFLEHWLFTTGEFLDGEAQFPEPLQAGSKKAQALGSSRTSQLSLAKLHYYMPIKAARRQIWIENAYFLPDKDFLAALCAAARRGVDVRVVVPGSHADIKVVHYAGRRYYRRLMEAGVRVYEYQPTMLHSKVMLIDGLWCSIGSINFTGRSMKSNAEVSAAIYDKDFAEQVRASIEMDLANSELINLKDWKQRGSGERIKECFFGLYAGWF
jgi:cardiolipin synthase A/B